MSSFEVTGVPIDELQAFLAGAHPDPFQILGPHLVGEDLVVRIFRPDAKEAPGFGAVTGPESGGAFSSCSASCAMRDSRMAAASRGRPAFVSAVTTPVLTSTALTSTATILMVRPRANEAQRAAARQRRGVDCFHTAI